MEEETDARKETEASKLERSEMMWCSAIGVRIKHCRPSRLSLARFRPENEITAGEVAPCCVPQSLRLTKSLLEPLAALNRRCLKLSHS